MNLEPEGILVKRASCL